MGPSHEPGCTGAVPIIIKEVSLKGGFLPGPFLHKEILWCLKFHHQLIYIVLFEMIYFIKMLTFKKNIYLFLL